MRYGLSFEIEMYDFVENRGETFYSRPGDYLHMKMWADKNLDADLAEDIRNVVTNYATAYFALKREGRVDDLGLPAELTFESVLEMADRWSVHVEFVEKDSLPLAGQGE